MAARRPDCGLAIEAERRQGGTPGDLELGLHQVHAGDLLRDRVLHLQARIALDEVVAAGLGRYQELDRAGVHEFRRPGERDRVGEQPLPHRLVQPRSRSAFHDLLVAQLDRTVPFVQVDHRAMGIGEDLHLDVPRPLDELLEEQRAVTEGGGRLTPAALECLGHVLRRVHGAHTPPAPSQGGLQHHRIAQVGRQRPRVVR